MTTPSLPATEPDMQNEARRSCAAARAWQQGIRLARLLREHDVPRPRVVDTMNVTGPDEGQTHVYAHMASAADLLRLAYRTGSKLAVCETSQHTEDEQMYIDLGWGSRRGIAVLWAGPVSA